MTREIVFGKRILFFLVTGLVVTGSAFAPTTEAIQPKPACADAPAIQKAILAKLAADPSFNVACKHNDPNLTRWRKDSDHLAVEVKDGKATLLGFVISPSGDAKESKALINKAVALARSASACKKVGHELRTQKDQGCSRAQFTCPNGLCVPSAASCP